jgi:hypothetical protein
MEVKAHMDPYFTLITRRLIAVDYCLLNRTRYSFLFLIWVPYVYILTRITEM